MSLVKFAKEFVYHGVFFQILGLVLAIKRNDKVEILECFSEPKTAIQRKQIIFCTFILLIVLIQSFDCVEEHRGLWGFIFDKLSDNVVH